MGKIEFEEKHVAALKEIGYQYDTLDVLWRLERRAHKLAEDMCNLSYSTDYYDGQLTTIESEVKAVFGGKLPQGFFINTDPRGYALKCQDPKINIVTDWGGYQLLAYRA